MSLPRNRSGPIASMHRVRLLVEIRNQDQQPAAAEVLGHLVQRRAQAARTGRLQAIEHVQHDVHVLGRGRHVLDDVVVERDEPDAVALAVHQIGQAAGQHLAVIELGDAAAAVAHRLRHVEQHREVGVRVRLVLLYVVPVRARVQPPVDAADVVARDVAAVLGEIHRRAEVRRAVDAVDEAVDDRAGDELEVPDAREHHGIDEPGAGDG